MTKSKLKSLQSSCLVKLQKPLRWILKRTYLLFRNETSQHIFRNKKELESDHNSIVTSKLSVVKDLSQKIYSSDNGATHDLRDKDEVIFNLLRLPAQVRKSIYDLIEMSAVLSLRLTCAAIKRDIETLHGLYIRVHDSKLDYDKPLQRFGIARLHIEQLIQDDVNNTCALPHPELLKTLVISGPISNINMEFFLRVSYNLTKVHIDFQCQSRQIPASILMMFPLNNLRLLHISCTSLDISACQIVKNNIIDVLNIVSCPNVRKLEVDINAILPQDTLNYNMHVYRFVLRNTSLRNVEIHIKQMENAQTNVVQPREEILLNLEERNTTPVIDSMFVNVNSNVQFWYCLLDSQRSLRYLNLKMEGLSWNRLILALDKNSKTLRNVAISDVCSISQDGTSAPVDLGLVRNLKSLDHLEIHYADMESRGLESPNVLRMSTIPLTIKSIKIAHLRLKPHQAMFLFVKLPLLEKVGLQCWSDTEGTLAAFYSVIIFLIKFDMTPVKLINLTDYRRRMENQENNISEMRNALYNLANITQMNTELYSTLTIKRYNINQY